MEKYELYHHGILGMKWGVRRYQNADGTWTAAGKKRYGDSEGTNNDKESPKSSNKYDRAIAKNSKQRASILSAREKNRSRIEARLNKKIDKAKNEKKKAVLQEAKKDRLKDFDEGTKLVKAGFDRYENVIKNYRDAKVKSLIAKDYKQTATYKLIRNQYANQKISDFVYGKSYTKLSYASATANKTGEERERFVRGGVSKRGTYH